MQQIAAAYQVSPLLHRHVSRLLPHPLLIRVRRESCQIHPASPFEFFDHTSGGRNGTRLAAQIDESQNRPFAVFGRLPRIEEETRIIDGKKASLIAIERPRQIERPVL